MEIRLVYILVGTVIFGRLVSAVPEAIIDEFSKAQMEKLILCLCYFWWWWWGKKRLC